VAGDKGRIFGTVGNTSVLLTVVGVRSLGIGGGALSGIAILIARRVLVSVVFGLRGGGLRVVRIATSVVGVSTGVAIRVSVCLA
jgi:hypothetical protein